VAAYEAAEQPMLNTSPYSQSSDAVQIMTVFKAKGLEFDYVFLVACDDGVWGSRASGVGNKLTLPANLAAIRHAGSTDDERLRLLYVAITRARHSLHLTSHQQSFSGRTTGAIKYFNEQEQDGVWQTSILPDGFQKVSHDDQEPPSLEALALQWQHRHYGELTSLKELLEPRLKRYRLSPTHLTHFIDLQYGGPESFLLGTILRFPSAPTVDTCFGNAIHATLQWLQGELNRTGTLPSTAQATSFARHFLERQPLTAPQLAIQSSRAKHALEQYLAVPSKRFTRGNAAEVSFRDEGVFIGDVHLGGAIDLLEIDTTAKTITVVDYKTGKLGSDPAKLHRYTLQLYCYKLLVEGSHTYRGYTVDSGRLVFVEPDDAGAVVEKTIAFTQTELDRTRRLLVAMWQRVTALDMPDTSEYGSTLKDIRAFEDMLIDTIGATPK
jgi:DNA helicase-2/ATP-dependent DNA helicase PcrA